MTKRITYLQRRPDLPAEQFSRHWQTPHAEIAVDLPGVVGYWQNHVLTTLPPAAAAGGFTVDGIVELWFTTADIAQSGTTSATSDRLIEDEPRFLSGLTGAPVTEPRPAPRPEYALWLLAWTEDGSAPAPQVREAIEEALHGLPGVGATTAHTLDPDGEILVRAGLDRMPALPHCAFSAGFTSGEAAQRAALALQPALGSVDGGIYRTSTLTAAVVPIIERAET
jgi:hypothetical protein